MTLAGYVDSIMECSCYDPDCDDLDFVEGWLARQPTAAPAAKHRSKEVKWDRRSLTAATKKTERDSLTDEFPDLFGDKREQEQAVIAEIEQIQKQYRPTPSQRALQLSERAQRRQVRILIKSILNARQSGLDQLINDTKAQMAEEEFVRQCREAAEARRIAAENRMRQETAQKQARERQETAQARAQQQKQAQDRANHHTDHQTTHVRRGLLPTLDSVLKAVLKVADEVLSMAISGDGFDGVYKGEPK